MKAKKKLGILGGMGSRASSLLFRKFIDLSPAVKDQEFTEVLLHNNSAIPDRTRAIVYNEASPMEELMRSVRLFNDNKIDLVVMACVTACYYLKELRLHSTAEIIDPIRLVKEHIQKKYKDVRKVGLLATTGTLSTRLFHHEFQHSGIELITLNKEDQENLFMKSVYMENGLKSSCISDEAIDLFYQTIPKLLDQGAEIIIGGCTEVQIMLQQNTLSIPYIDVMDLAAQEAVRICYDMDEYVAEPAVAIANHYSL